MPLTQLSEQDHLGFHCGKSLLWGPATAAGSCIAIANRKLVVIRGCLKLCNPSVKEKTYLSVVRLSLEYAFADSRPLHWTVDMSWPEQVQSNAARFFCNSYSNYKVSSSELVLSLGWDALGVRRLYNQSIFNYFKSSTMA